jgi:hypothetical protein
MDSIKASLLFLIKRKKIRYTLLISQLKIHGSPMFGGDFNINFVIKNYSEPYNAAKIIYLCKNARQTDGFRE